MSRQKQDWDDWVNLDIPGEDPVKLRDDAPDDIKKKFEEWRKKEAEYKKKGWYV